VAALTNACWPIPEKRLGPRLGADMRLYLFEHCSLCFRVRMAAALKHLHLQEMVVLEDDSETMIGLVGKRVIPILVKDDGRAMLESMDMVAHIDSLGGPVLTGPERADALEHASLPSSRPPRVRHGAALDHYIARKRKRLGDFVELRAKTREQIDALMPELETLDGLVESPTAVNGKLSLDDIRVLPLLRAAAVVPVPPLRPGGIFHVTVYLSKDPARPGEQTENVIAPAGARGVVSLAPSIGNWSFPCNSHYWITGNEVRWAADVFLHSGTVALLDDLNFVFVSMDVGSAKQAVLENPFHRCWAGPVAM